jgi:hypothetical protein
MPTFQVDVYGSYTAFLEVKDDLSTSVADEVLVSFEKLAPVADAGVEQAVLQGNTAFLDATGSSDPNGDSLAYQWSIVSKPQGSQAIITSSMSA